MTITTDYREKITKSIEETIATRKATFTETLKLFFEDHPEVAMVTWEQYTPYWNDGESCEFGTYNLFYIMSGSPGEPTLREDDIDDSIWNHPDSTEEIEGQSLDFIYKPGFYNFLLEIFGNSKRIIISRNKIIVKTCSHN